jgi:hypothetical protein
MYIQKWPKQCPSGPNFVINDAVWILLHLNLFPRCCFQRFVYSWKILGTRVRRNGMGNRADENRYALKAGNPYDASSDHQNCY